MYAICAGGQKAAKERLSRAGWRVGYIRLSNASFEVMSKMGAMVVFEPDKGDDGYASLPGMFELGWQPLQKGNALYEEAINCLSDIH